MKRLGVFLLPPGWDASPSQGTGYSQHFAGTHLYTWVERGTVGVKCLAQEHNTMFPARNRTRTIRSGVEHTSHEATAPPKNLTVTVLKETTTATATPTPKSSIILLVKRGKNDRASCAASIFVHFCSVLVKTTTQNDQFSGFHVNEGKQHWIFSSLSLLQIRVYQSCYSILRSYYTTQTRWKNRRTLRIIAQTNSLKWRFRHRSRRGFLSI